MSPEIAFFNYPTTKYSTGWVYNYFKPYKYIQKLNSEIIASPWSTSDNNLFSFYISRNTIESNIKRGVPQNDRLINFCNTYPEIEYFINYEEDSETTITLAKLISAMSYGDKLSLYWYSQFDTKYPALYSSLQSLYPNFTSDSLVIIEKLGISTQAKVEIMKNNIKCEYITNGTVSQTAKGEGFIPTQNSTASLITLLKKLPIGNYYEEYFTDTSISLLGQIGFGLEITILSNNGTNITAIVHATNRNTNPARDIVELVCYINSGSGTQYDWKKITTSNT